MIKPALTSSSSVHSTSSLSSSTSATSASAADPDYRPVVLKWSRDPADFRDMLHAYSKLRDLPQAPNIVTFYGATREHPSATTSVSSTMAGSSSMSFSERAGSLATMAMSISSLSLSSVSGSSSLQQQQQQEQQAEAAVLPRDWIVTKPSAHGTLHEFLKSPQGEALDWMDKIRLIRGVASGLMFLHEHGQLHMNLHSDNVLIENGPTAVLTDFGQASRSARRPESHADQSPPTHHPSSSPRAVPGSRWVHGGGVFEKGLIYTAPERLANPELNPCTTASDIYALGVIMLEIMTGHRSHASHFLTSSSADHSHLRLEESSKTGRVSTPLPTMSTPHGTMTLPTAMESLIRRICSRDPAQRPGLFVIRSQLKEMANTSFDLHVREPINKGTTGIQLNAKKPISLISVVTTPSVIAGEDLFFALQVQQ